MSPHPPPAHGITAVDLDGTLLRTDLLWEASAHHATSRVTGVLEIVRWAMRGRSHLKSELAARVRVDAAALPYKAEVVAELRQISEAGGPVVIATAAARSHAEAVADHLGFISAVLATDPGGANLKGEAKAEAIADYAHGQTWTYYGDSRADIPVWRRADAAVAVDPDRPARRALAAAPAQARIITSATPSTTSTWISALRVHQWTKNILVLVPLVTGHLLFEGGAALRASAAVGAFCMMASAIYLLNDLADIDADRAHPAKRSRASPSGLVSIPLALGASAALSVAALALSALLGWLFLGVIVAYAIGTTLYSVWIKRKIVADVVGLALLYTWRIIAGCVAIAVVPSIWILAFSVFVFLSLAVMKRFAEIINHGRSAAGRDYHEVDVPLLLALGMSSGVAAVLVAVLYLDSPQVHELYATPQALWAVIPLLVYWIVRIWMVAVRGGVDDDPLVFALTDRTSLIVFALIAVAAAMAMVL